MPKKKTPELSPAEQLRRFKKAAKEAGLTDDEAQFERAFRSVAREKRPTKGGTRPK